MAGLEGWKYYNHALIPDRPPHDQPDPAPVESGTAWKQEPRALLARWTTDFDCGYETGWWYVIKDTPFDLAALKAKRRYEINKGSRYFEIRRIDPNCYREELFAVEKAAFAGWPEKYRPKADHGSFVRSAAGWDRFRVYGAFHRDEGILCGYALVKVSGNWADFCVLRTMPRWESQAVNAALVSGILTDLGPFLEQGGYLCDGSRSISHETAFQDYLEKYFGFRKAWCRLHLRFRPGIGAVLGCLYPLRKLLRRWDGIGLVHQINGLLKMKEIAQTQEERANG